MESVTAREQWLADKLAALERWAEEVDPDDMKWVDTTLLKSVSRLADQRDETEKELAQAVAAARQGGWSWGHIGLMLGVSRQAAQQKYGAKVTELAQAQ